MKIASAELESLRAVVRCLGVHIGISQAEDRVIALVDAAVGHSAWRFGTDLAPHVAYHVRKLLETQLPD